MTWLLLLHDRYSGKAEIWLANADHELNIGFYDIGARARVQHARTQAGTHSSRSLPRSRTAIELPLNAKATAGDSLPIYVTLNTNLVTVNTTVTGLGLLKSYLMLCPGQDVPQQLAGGNTQGTLTDASAVTNIYVGETYCLQVSMICRRARCRQRGATPLHCTATRFRASLLRASERVRA